MEPFSLLAALLFVGMAVELDRSEKAEARRKAILGDRKSFPHDDDRLLFDLLVARYRETGNVHDLATTYWMYERAKENGIPGEVVSKVCAAVRQSIREGRLSKWEFRATPQSPRFHTIETQTGHRVKLGRLIYVDVLGLYEREGRSGLNRYNAMRDYVEKSSSVLEIQYDERTQEFWAWLPTPDNRWYAVGLRQWRTISKKWPDLVDPEVAYFDYPPRPKMNERE